MEGVEQGRPGELSLGKEGVEGLEGGLCEFGCGSVDLLGGRGVEVEELVSSLKGELCEVLEVELEEVRLFAK